VILDFWAEQDKLDLYSTLILLCYDFLNFKADYFPYFNITNSLAYLAIIILLFRFVVKEASFKWHQIVLKITASFHTTFSINVIQGVSCTVCCKTYS